MKQIIFITTIMLFAGILNAQQKEVPARTDQVIIKYKKEDASAKSKIKQINKKYNVLSITKVRLGKKSKQFVYTIKFPAAVNIYDVIEEYNRTGALEYAEPDCKGSVTGTQNVAPNDQYYFRQYALKNNGTFSLSPAISGADINMENAWTIEQGDTNIVVGVIDSGCKLDHPEFSGRIWRNYGEIANNGIDDDSNGKVDDIQGWDFANGDNNPVDDHGHGTGVTGIIGAKANNAIGYAGVDWNCKLMVLKGIDNTGAGYYSWWSDAIYYAVDNGAHVINMSLTGTGASATLQAAINYALSNNVTVVAAMGNENTNTIRYPACYAGVIAVGSTDANDNRSNPFSWSSTSGSNFGSYISVVAPGNHIYSISHLSNTNYSSYWSGTSQAAPHATGVVALLLAQNLSRTPALIKSIIETSAEDQVGKPTEDVAGWDQYHGHGRLNAFNALTSVVGIEEINNASFLFELFSNPSVGEVNIFLAEAPDRETFATLTNSLGQEVLKEKLHSQHTTLHTSVTPGIYFVTVSQSTKRDTKKIIIL